MKVQKTENGFKYIDFGAEAHGKYSFRLWINNKIPLVNEELVFPVENAKIFKTENGTLVLKVTYNYLVHKVFKQCGFRGSSSLLVKGVYDSFEYRVFSSPLGNTGISSGMLINVPSKTKITIQWKSTGRSDDTAGSFEIYDKDITYIENIIDLESLVKELN